MYRALENSLYIKNPTLFNIVKNKASSFIAANCGNNIMQDDIFLVMENYAKKQGMALEVFQLPVEDEELCACTFLREDRIFVLINISLPLSKQIFAAAHELYHVMRYFEGEEALIHNGSILKSETIDEEATEQEDMEANAFAAQLLVPVEALNQQMAVYDIAKNSIGVAEVLLLMDIFAIPYKAMVLRMFEERWIDEDNTRELFTISKAEIQRQQNLTGKGARWHSSTESKIGFGNLENLINYNAEMGLLTESRLADDKARVAKMREEYLKK